VNAAKHVFVVLEVPEKVQVSAPTAHYLHSPLDNP